jgi:hypothetical protein
MDKFINTPLDYIPTLGTKPRQLLEVLWDGQDHSSKELLEALESDPRSPIQSLKRDWGFWLIHNTGAKQGCYQLDERHLSGIPELDRQARMEAELAYNQKSYKQCESESRRQPKALITLKMTKEKFRAEIQLEFDL